MLAGALMAQCWTDVARRAFILSIGTDRCQNCRIVLQYLNEHEYEYDDRYAWSYNYNIRTNINTHDRIVSADKGKQGTEENPTCLANVYCNRENVQMTVQCLRMKRELMEYSNAEKQVR